MVSPLTDPKACWEFEGEILVLHHPTTISVKYQAMGKLMTSTISLIVTKGSLMFIISERVLVFIVNIGIFVFIVS